MHCSSPALSKLLHSRECSGLLPSLWGRPFRCRICVLDMRHQYLLHSPDCLAQKLSADLLAQGRLFPLNSTRILGTLGEQPTKSRWDINTQRTCTIAKREHIYVLRWTLSNSALKPSQLIFWLFRICLTCEVTTGTASCKANTFQPLHPEISLRFHVRAHSAAAAALLVIALQIDDWPI